MVRQNTKKRKRRASLRTQTKAKRLRRVQRNTKTRKRKETVSIKVKEMRSRIYKWILAGEKISLHRLVKEFGPANFSKSWKIAKTIYKVTIPNWGIPKREVSPETNSNIRKNNERGKEFKKLSPSAQKMGIPSLREQHPKSNTIKTEHQESKKKEYHTVPVSSRKAEPSAYSVEEVSDSSVDSSESESESSSSSEESVTESSTSSSESEAESSIFSSESETDLSESEEEIYEVERIVRRRKKRGVWMYRVKWKGFDTKDNTWEPEENLTCCKEMLENFLKNCTRRQRS